MKKKNAESKNGILERKCKDTGGRREKDSGMRKEKGEKGFEKIFIEKKKKSNRGKGY